MALLEGGQYSTQVITMGKLFEFLYFEGMELSSGTVHGAEDDNIWLYSSMSQIFYRRQYI